MMVPMKVCNPVSKVVPGMEPVNHCVETPKEICEYVTKNKRKIRKPMVKKWCGPKRDDDDDDSGGRGKIRTLT